MKFMKVLAACLVFISISTVSLAQTKTETFKVSGNCGMCKSTIEKAAKEAGATVADWNKDSKELTVTYASTTTNTAKIQEKIALAGYDNEGYTATKDAYNKLHGCCKYDRKNSTAGKAAHKCGENCDMKEGHDKMDCCKGGKCEKEGHKGKGDDCCAKKD